MPTILLKRGIKADFESGVISHIEGEPLYFTDDNTIAIANSSTPGDFSVMQKVLPVAPVVPKPYYQGTIQGTASTQTNFRPNFTTALSSGFNLQDSNRTVVAEIAGTYHVIASQLFTTSGNMYFTLRKNAATVKFGFSNSDSTYDVLVSAIVYLDVGDYVDIICTGIVTSSLGGDNSSISIMKVD